MGRQQCPPRASILQLWPGRRPGIGCLAGGLMVRPGSVVDALRGRGTVAALDVLVDRLAVEVDQVANADPADRYAAVRAFLAAIEARGRAEVRRKRAELPAAPTGRPASPIDELLDRRERRAGRPG